jgi:hypothetical protein
MDDLVRWKKGLPSKRRVKKIKSSWLGIIDTLWKMSATCDSLMEKKRKLFLK